MVGSSVNLSYRGMANMKAELGTFQTYNEVRLGFLGVQIGPATASVGIKHSRGVFIGNLVDGPAKAAGIQSGDAIIQIDGKDIDTLRDLIAVISQTPLGKSVQVGIVHNGKDEQKTLKVGPSPAQAEQISTSPVTPPSGSVLPVGVMKGGTIECTLLLLAALFLTLASREITQPEWDLEWLVTLPLPLSTLLASRLIERAVTNVTGFVALGPFLSVFAWACGYRWTAPLVGLGLTFVLLFVVAVAQTLVDTGLRLSLSPPKLRNLQAIISIVTGLPLLLAMSMTLREDVFIFGWAAALPDWTGWLPNGLAVRALAATDPRSAVLWSAVMVGEIVVIFAAGFALLHWQLRYGVMAAGAREAVGRGPRAVRRTADFKARRALISTVQRRELRLLGRDRTFMVQTLVLPPLMVGAQVLIRVRTNIFAGAVEHPQNLAAIAFGLAAYTLMLSAFQTLNAEGQALWILYTVPQSLDSILRQKAKLWASLATIYPFLLFAVAVAFAGTVSRQFLGSAAIVLSGVPIFAVVATALGVFACDPLAQEVRRRIRLTYLYLYMTLASLYTFAVYASTIWQSIAMMILTALLAIALWQKARDRFDYLLDPSATPPARVSVSDGLIAALMFFVLQAVVIITFEGGAAKANATTMLWVAFCVAGAVTYAAMRLVYWRAHTAGVPHMFGDGMPWALLWGVAGGVAAALAGITYIQIIGSMNLFPAAQRASLVSDRPAAIALAALAIVAAPIFEEFIFRGLIFGGLRRSLGFGVATLASAAIFAIVHPPLSVVPVFIMGVCAALVYDRTKMLAAPMLVHAIYNAAVIGFQWNVMQ